jgi:hypothetical protein
MPRPFRMLARAPAAALRAIRRTSKTFPVNWAFTPSNLGQKHHVPSYAASERGQSAAWLETNALPRCPNCG